MNRFRSCWVLFCLCCSLAAGAQTGGTGDSARTHFTVVPLGVRGGLDESNLSAYMVAPAGSNDYVCMDAGTLYAGIRKAVESGASESGRIL